MSDLQTKETIQRRLADFSRGRLADNALALFAALGYRSDKRIELAPNTAATFCAAFDEGGRLNATTALLAEWRSVDMLFQLTGDEVTDRGQARFLFDADTRVDNTIIQSYLFFAIELAGEHYTRSQLAGITREINKLFLMPAMILFRYGPCVTLSIINRRLHKRDEGRDVLEKVTLIKDIATATPHRAHIEILFDLSLDELVAKHGFSNFVELHNAWQKTLDTAELNKRFFREVANWYFWAVQNVRFPAGAGADPETRNATSVIRLITRLIFVWFLKEKGLAPEALFDRKKLDDLLLWTDAQGSTYYKAILQNLFFATLNQEMNTPGKRDKRDFRKDGQHYNITNLYRYRAYFRDPDRALALFATIPFLNGGLFECLDKPGKDDTVHPVRVDGFSDRPDNELAVPDRLFFGAEQEVDLNAVYDTKNKRYKVRGLIPIFDSYKFTVTENTPIEEEIALDPELLSKVFENLLAAYNPETGVTARKQTGSFYTPREVVEYMVDESLIVYLLGKLDPDGTGDQADLEARLRHLFSYTDEPHRFTETQVGSLIEAIDQLKIIDTACGSGAFPMGILHKLVFILGKLDPGNERWKDKQIAKAAEITDPMVRERAIADIEQAFGGNELDYGRKLYLIQNCIYGVDIQPIAVQIAKLRCFISLIAEQRTDDAAPNRGILPLPNLETNFVAANTLLGIERPQQLVLHNPEIDEKEEQLAKVRRAHFTARTPKTKAKYREMDKALRQEIADLLERDGLPRETTQRLAFWDPYDQNASADFFDPEWMFGIREGFDIAISNPPYVRQEQIGDFKPSLKGQYDCYSGTADLYVYFYERSLRVLRDGGVLTFISSNKYFRAGYGEKLRRFLGERSTILHLIDFGDAPVFTAIAYPSIIIARKAPPGDNQTRALTWAPGPSVEEFAAVFRTRSFLIAQKKLAPDGWQLELPGVLRLLEKLRGAGQPLGEFTKDRLYRGVVTGMNDAFVVDRATRDRLVAAHPSSAELLKPYLRGRDIKRWRIDSPDLFLCYVGWELPIGKYPAIYAHLLEFEDELKARPEVQQGRVPWYALSRYASEYWQEFSQDKIVIPAIAAHTAYAPDLGGHFTNDKTSICITESVDYLLGLLNSNLLWWFIQQIAATKQGGFYEFKPMYVSQIPIRVAADRKPVEDLVARILAARRADPAADVSALEREIDQLVYRLYGLTAEEIAIVEDKAADSAASL